MQLQLEETSLQDEVGELLEQQGVNFEDDGLLHDELYDLELFDEEKEERLHDFLLDELETQLKLDEMQLRLELWLLLEQHGIISEDDTELQEELSELKLEDGQLEDSLLLCVLEEELMLLLLTEKLLQLGLWLLLEQHGTIVDDD